MIQVLYVLRVIEEFNKEGGQKINWGYKARTGEWVGCTSFYLVALLVTLII
jgi:hypothetical protein